MNKLIKYSYKTYQGTRSYMEDYFIIHEDESLSLFCILDGHGGYIVANFIKEDIKNKLLPLIINQSYESLKIILTDFFINEDEILKTKNIYNVGTTVILLLIYNNMIILLNIGDSFFIMNYDSNIFFSKDHNLLNIKEKERVNKYSFIDKNRVEGIINVTRTIGDIRFKKNKNIYNNPLIPIADIYNFPNYFNNNTWCLLASDGLNVHFNKEELRILIDIFLSIGLIPLTICNIFIDYLKGKTYNDNTTIILITSKNYKINYFYKKKVEKKKNFIKKKIIPKIKSVDQIYNQTNLFFINDLDKYISKNILFYKLLKPVILDEISYYFTNIKN